MMIILFLILSVRDLECGNVQTVAGVAPLAIVPFMESAENIEMKLRHGGSVDKV